MGQMAKWKIISQYHTVNTRYLVGKNTDFSQWSCTRVQYKGVITGQYAEGENSFIYLTMIELARQIKYAIKTHIYSVTEP